MIFISKLLYQAIYTHMNKLFLSSLFFRMFSLNLIYVELTSLSAIMNVHLHKCVYIGNIHQFLIIFEILSLDVFFSTILWINNLIVPIFNMITKRSNAKIIRIHIKLIC